MRLAFRDGVFMRALRRWRWRIVGLLVEDPNAIHEAAMDIDHGRTPRRPIGGARSDSTGRPTAGIKRETAHRGTEAP